MTARAQELLAPLERRLDALERLVSDTDDAGWERRCAAEGWPVALVAYHIARGFDRQTGWVEDLARGGSAHRYSWDETHALNARIAREHSYPSREDVLGSARDAIARLRAAIARIGDDALSRTVFANEGRERSIEWLLAALMPRHADEHLASIAAALKAERLGDRTDDQRDAARIRRAVSTDAPTLRALLNSAYRPLAEAGMNFTAATQDEERTRGFIEAREVYVIERAGELVGTITLRDRVDQAGTRHIYINGLAVCPDRQGQGLGRALLHFAEGVARERGVATLRLDTAKPATDLIELYTRAGYRIFGERHWQGKTYDSVIMEKVLSWPV